MTAHLLQEQIATMNRVGADRFIARRYGEAISHYKKALDLLYGGPFLGQNGDTASSAELRSMTYREDADQNAQRLPLPVILLSGAAEIDGDADSWARRGAISVMFNMALLYFALEDWGKTQRLLALVLETGGFSASQAMRDLEDVMQDRASCFFLQHGASMAPIMVTAFDLLGRSVFQQHQRVLLLEPAAAEQIGSRQERSMWSMDDAVLFLISAVGLAENLKNILQEEEINVGCILISLGQALFHLGRNEEAMLILNQATSFMQESYQECDRLVILGDQDLKERAAPAA
jgi:tetratricopeptide (TPR) repeat protein